MEKKIDVDKLTNDTIKQGGILAVLFFDMGASAKEPLQQLGTGFVQKLLAEPGVVYAVGEIDEPVENAGVFSTTVEVKILVKELASLARICGNYSPFSVEMKRPDEIKLTIDQAHALLMDIATTNYELKKLIIEKVYTPEDLEKFRKAFQNRMALSKKLLEKQGK